MADQGRNCPKCDLADRIRKVSSIVREGITTTSGTAETYVADERGHWTSAPYSGTQISGRANDLLPPGKPQASFNIGRRMAYIIGYFLLGTGGLPLLTISLNYPLGREVPASVTANDIIQFAAFLLIGLVIIGLANSESSKEKKQLQEMHSRWEHAVGRWNQLYYCERDDILFNPDDKDKRAIPVSEMNPYLNS